MHRARSSPSSGQNHGEKAVPVNTRMNFLADDNGKLFAIRGSLANEPVTKCRDAASASALYENPLTPVLSVPN